MKNLLAFCSSLLLITSLLGDLITPRIQVSNTIIKAPPHYYNNLLDPISSARDFDKLLSPADSQEDLIKSLLWLVRDSYAHKPDSPYTFSLLNNWLMYLASFFDERYLFPQDPFFLWKKGVGFCDQAAFIFVAAATKLGIKARVVRLNGHVIAEAFLPSIGGRMVDPDLGILWEHSLEEIGKSFSREHFHEVLITEGYGPEIIEPIEQAYFSTEDNRPTRFPYYPSVYKFELLSHFLKYLIPAFILLLCLARRKGPLQGGS